MIKELQNFLHKEIPLTKDMGLELAQFNGKNILIKAPLSNNINDKGSVFGGSSSALMIITAWSLIKLNCEKFQIQADIVVHKNETIWQKAMYQDLFLQATFKLHYDFNKIKSTLAGGRHQRIECLIELQDEDSKIYSTMTSKYVIIPKRAQQEQESQLK
ncbi:MAG: YiiD C-terminal domain-containing protein [Alcanivoracaceae bacterium]|nr:YiiD C-terminal domain-containing protein [Alcanivoracaceae bacterium]